jgi:hypothetical protein
MDAPQVDLVMACWLMKGAVRLPLGLLLWLRLGLLLWLRLGLLLWLRLGLLLWLRLGLLLLLLLLLARPALLGRVCWWLVA